MRKNLTEYNFPEDLKSMTDDEMELLCIAIRDFLIEKISKTGGHLASNLGVVELTVGIHRVFDSPEDRIVWDVGHQSYVHKILTGRAGGFDHLRQTGGMSGFPKACESPHDAYDTGHSSTSISAAAGIAAARDLKGEDYNVIAVIGDGSLTGGMAYEAMNNIGASKSNVIVIINDNGMSIDKNIGGMSDYLTRLRMSKGYLEAKKNIKETLNRIPGVGKGLANGISGAKDKLKYALISDGILFEELGFTYIGPIDGHDIGEVIETLEHARQIEGPVVIHAMTKKGKGYRIAEKDPDRFHGIRPFDVETGKTAPSKGTSWSKAMGQNLVRIAEQDSSVVAITAAMGSATGLSGFAKRWPDRCFDVGIAEAHAVTFAAGLAKNGMKPLVAIYSSFLQRAYDQIVEDVCLQDLPVVFAIDRAGIVGADGETHHGVLDLSYLSSIPNMTVLTPASASDLRSMMEYAFRLGHPVAIRYPRGICPEDTRNDEFDGRNRRVCPGRDVDIWAEGPMLEQALRARAYLSRKGIRAGVVEVLTVKPMDTTPFDPEIPYIVTLEDGLVRGGFGMALASELSGRVRVESFGWPDRFIQHGSVEDLYKMYQLDGESVAERICEHIERKA